MINKRLFIEYTGTYPNQNFYYNGDCRTFWQLKDGRQVIDCLTTPAYNHALKHMDNVSPFVPVDDSDWEEVMSLMEKAEKAKAKKAKEERISFLTDFIKSTASKVEGILGNITSLEVAIAEAQDEAKAVSEQAEAYVKELAVLKPKRKPRKKPEKKK